MYTYNNTVILLLFFLSPSIVALNYQVLEILEEIVFLDLT